MKAVWILKASLRFKLPHLSPPVDSPWIHRYIAEPRRQVKMNTNFLQVRMQRLFTDGFTVLDISEALISFDADRDAAEVQRFMGEKNMSITGIRKDGVVAGYTTRDQLTGGKCGEHIHSFDDKMVLSATASLQEVMEALGANRYCFVSVLGKVGGIVSRTDIQKPPVRMWLFGMITIS
jgi:hypothetical protein